MIINSKEALLKAGASPRGYAYDLRYDENATTNRHGTRTFESLTRIRTDYDKKYISGRIMRPLVVHTNLNPTLYA